MRLRSIHTLALSTGPWHAEPRIGVSEDYHSHTAVGAAGAAGTAAVAAAAPPTATSVTTVPTSTPTTSITTATVKEDLPSLLKIL